MKLSCMIVDDERHALAVLQGFIGRTPQLEPAGAYTDPNRALAAVTSGPAPAIAFLDVDMPGMNGLELAAKFPKETVIVFTTSFREYAADAYEQAAADYLLKPVTYERFLRCITRISERLSPAAPPLLFVRDALKGAAVPVPPTEILFLSAALNYVEIQLINEKILVYSGLEAILKQLPERFCRVHRSYIVNLDQVARVESQRVVLKTGGVVPLGRAFKKGLTGGATPA